jgi:hypothetical protein
MSSNTNNNTNQRYRNFNVIKERLRKNREATNYNSNYDRVNPTPYIIPTPSQKPQHQYTKKPKQMYPHTPTFPKP